MRRVSRRRYVEAGLLVGLLITLLLGLGRPAAAHGGTVRLDGDYGSYHVIAATGPGTKAGDLVLTVVLSTVDKGNGTAITPILGAVVSATFTLTGTTQAPVTYALPTEPTLGEFGYYEHIVTVPGDGDWLVRLDVTSPTGTASAQFPVTLRTPPAVLQNGWVQWAILLLPILAALAVLAYLWRGRRPPTGATS